MEQAGPSDATEAHIEERESQRSGRGRQAHSPDRLCPRGRGLHRRTGPATPAAPSLHARPSPPPPLLRPTEPERGGRRRHQHVSVRRAGGLPRPCRDREDRSPVGKLVEAAGDAPAAEFRAASVEDEKPRRHGVFSFGAPLCPPCPVV